MSMLYLRRCRRSYYNDAECTKCSNASNNRHRRVLIRLIRLLEAAFDKSSRARARLLKIRRKSVLFGSGSPGLSPARYVRAYAQDRFCQLYNKRRYVRTSALGIIVGSAPGSCPSERNRLIDPECRDADAACYAGITIFWIGVDN